MSSNPHAQPLLQSEDDVSESLRQLRLDEPRDDGQNASTATTTPPSSLRPRASIPEAAIEELCELLDDNIKSSDDDSRIQGRLNIVWFSVNEALKKDKNLETFLANQEEFRANLKKMGEQQFIGVLRDMAKTKHWRDLVNNNVFFKEIQSDEKVLARLGWTESSMKASLHAWVATFQGEAANVLLNTIADYLNKTRGRVYSRHTSIINSSGTGKSRMVDELATKIITVPMCLRDEGTEGFPPPDLDLRDWLKSIATKNLNNRAEATQNVYGFVASLLIVLRGRLQEIASGDYGIPKLPLGPYDVEDQPSVVPVVKERQGLLASTFRRLMTSDPTFKHHNDYRKSFYKDVIDLANKWANSSHIPKPDTNKPHKPDTNKPDGPPGPPKYENEGLGNVTETGERLCKLIDPRGVLDSGQGPRWPLIILAFDESHILTDNPKNSGWTLFSELRRALREIVDWPIFSLFLSTAGSFHLFSPEIAEDMSSRVIKGHLFPLSPISEISFDDLAFPAKEDTVSLDRVVRTDWVSHLGRPLFGAFYDALKDENKLMLFAREKLLNGRYGLEEGDGPGSLACLSVRFSLEFNADAVSRDVTCKQVERHMRLCLAATTGFTKLITLSGSEPLLAEAAWQLMSNSSAKPVRHLANHSDLHCIDRGRRGELVAALLVMQARDSAVAKQLEREKYEERERPEGRRAVSVSDFMRALLPQSSYEALQSTKPTLHRADEDRRFDETFGDYAMWFNHVIKIEDPKLINADYLWTFIMRGAMVLCAQNQLGVDIVLPICLKKGNLSRHNVSAILIQVKNDDRYGASVDKTLFDGLNPVRVGLFKEGSHQRPVIRMVFALASKKGCVVLPAVRERDRGRYFDDCTTFDIWCAGLSSFKDVEEDLTSYQILLDRSLQPHDAFELGELKGDKELGDSTRESRGRRRRRMAALTMVHEDHRRLHL